MRLSKVCLINGVYSLKSRFFFFFIDMNSWQLNQTSDRVTYIGRIWYKFVTVKSPNRNDDKRCDGKSRDVLRRMKGFGSAEREKRSRSCGHYGR